MSDSLARRLWTYQAERYPLAAYVPLMAVAALAAVAVPAAAREADRLPWTGWGIGTVTLVVFFFFLRALDEHKDAPDDARYRPELPVPRGLVSLGELSRAAVVGVLAVVVLNALYAPAVLVPLAAALAWAGFMGREFFVREWLRARPLAYLLSHMLVMPLVFLYATSLDWLAAGAPPPPGTASFLALAFFNGLVIEVGRKVRSPERERDGVDTYTAAWGTRTAVGVWMASVLAAAGAGVAVATVLGAATVAPAVLAGLALLALAPAVTVLSRSRADAERWIEPASAGWVLASYATMAVVGYVGVGG